MANIKRFRHLETGFVLCFISVLFQLWGHHCAEINRSYQPTNT